VVHFQHLAIALGVAEGGIGRLPMKRLIPTACHGLAVLGLGIW
jgi:hypothetical protein